MYTLIIANAVKKMLANKIRDFICENYYKWIGFSMENSYYYAWKKDWLLLANKLIEKILDPCTAKEHYQSFIRRKNRKSVKQSKIITYQPKTHPSFQILCKTQAGGYFQYPDFWSIPYKRKLP